MRKVEASIQSEFSNGIFDVARRYVSGRGGSSRNVVDGYRLDADVAQQGAPLLVPNTPTAPTFDLLVLSSGAFFVSSALVAL